MQSSPNMIQGMRLVSVNIGQERRLQVGKKLESTGIFKQANYQPVQVTELGLQADFIRDGKNHGGPDQAVYVYGEPDYAWWSRELQREFPPGTFGENLTVSGLESATFAIGDRLHAGEVILEVSAPRIPCSTLSSRMGDPQFVKRFRAAERPGLYCRVIRAGVLQVGEDVSVVESLQANVRLLDVFRGFYDRHKSEAELRRQLSAPIAMRTRADLEEELRILLAKA
ncbi:MAG TPA: MOSC domain-containing protein [Anaerolineales bacterium]